MSFSIKWLFAIIAIAAIFTAALVYRAELWASAAILLAIALLLTATCGVWVHHLDRSFWIPFCVVGWFYLLVALSDRVIALAPYLPSTYLAQQLERQQPPQPPSDLLILSFRRSADILHALFALLVGGIAGGVSVFVKRPSDR